VPSSAVYSRLDGIRVLAGLREADQRSGTRTVAVRCSHLGSACPGTLWVTADPAAGPNPDPPETLPAAALAAARLYKNPMPR